MRMRQIHSIRVIPVLFLLSVVAPAALAQLTGLPEYGVLLSGTPDNPVVLNQSPHRILAFALRTRREGQDRFSGTHSNQVGLSQLTRGNADPDGPGIPPGGTSLSLQPFPVGIGIVNGQRADIGNAEATLDSVLFDDGLFVGPDLGHVYESITARIAAEVSVDSILLSAKTDSEFTRAWEQIKQIAETPPGTTRSCFAYIASANVCAFSHEGPPVEDRNSPSQFANQLLFVRDRLGEKSAVAQAASSLTYPKIHKE